MSNDLNLYTTSTLTGIFNKVQADPRYFLSYFPRSQTHEAEVIMFDETEQSLEVMEYSHHKAAAKSLQKTGYKTKMFRPFYLKQKFSVDDQAFTRLPGEAIGGSLTAAERARLQLVAGIKKLRENFERKLEAVAGEVVTTGKLKVQAKGEFDYLVDFGRKASHTKNLTKDDAGEKPWSLDTAPIIDQLEAWGQEMLENSGENCATIVFGADAWKAFRKNKKLEQLLDLRRGVSLDVEMTPTKAINGIAEKGYLGVFRLLVNSGKYFSPYENKYVTHMPADSVLLLADIQGVKHFGAIKDRGSLQAIPYYARSYETDDPRERFVLAESSPLLVPMNPNASMLVKVV